MVSLISVSERGNPTRMDTHLHPSLYSQWLLLDLLCVTYGECMPLHFICNSFQFHVQTTGKGMGTMEGRKLPRRKYSQPFLYVVDSCIRLSPSCTPPRGYLEATNDH